MEGADPGGDRLSEKHLTVCFIILSYEVSIMFQVTPVRSRELQAELAAAVGCPFIENTFAFCAVELSDDATEVRGLIALCQFTYSPEEAVIRSVGIMPESEGDEAVTVLIRGVMAFLNRAEIPFVYADETAASPEQLKAWSFRRGEDGRLGIDLKKFYKAPCHYDDDAK